MKPVYCWISLGSNYERHHQISRALQALQTDFGELRVSRIFETQPVGIKVKSCAPFYNLVAGFYTNLKPSELNARLKKIEGNEKYLLPEDQSIYVRALDLDIINWDNLSGLVDGVQLPYPDLLKHDFVLLPMAELEPNQRPAGYQQTYLELWQAHAHTDQVIKPVDFTWP
ncbi:MAG TPA: 2-amino-4-hydroxy-6-hydroxymethyldihydropteridine diphosphokinase [Marinospirillum sp.]|uniref:2-amino-4-hydroxy-6- hydroxymethyldihydropteridine diphosphokinase n=1 Tax=Marinospirillum sp. TaxID=2183934 RepID=UPI002B4A1C21|nr:2-amino-4-hydroxy-6-hydroxymethyldihydropteridine diphosphokinase [Marinospirillum sp.]HKM14961.1 2-amino-4-hydroxy-6-hydroxymethyldihydropteridine diphosphokinase [Marinospirillum sp.]